MIFVFKSDCAFEVKIYFFVYMGWKQVVYISWYWDIRWNHYLNFTYLTFGDLALIYHILKLWLPFIIYYNFSEFLYCVVIMSCRLVLRGDMINKNTKKGLLKSLLYPQNSTLLLYPKKINISLLYLQKIHHI